MTAIEDCYAPPWVTTQAHSDFDECIAKVKDAVETWRANQIKTRKENYGDDVTFGSLDWNKIEKSLKNKNYYQPETDGCLDEGLQVSAAFIDLGGCGI
jgi:hypothetical protein